MKSGKINRMIETLFSINNDGKLRSAPYYTITSETLERKLFSDELIDEVFRRVIEPDCKNWKFSFDDLQVEILKKLEHKIEFFVSRDIPIWKQ
jgi:hypothetical protein